MTAFTFDTDYALCFDTETTGLPLHSAAPLAKQPKCIELAGVMLSRDDGRVLGEWTQLFDPGEPLTAEITKITGLHDADLVGQPKFADVLPELRRLFGRASLMIAHNLPFDRAIVGFELARCDVEDFPWPADGICTVGASRAEWGRNPKLSELYARVIGRELVQTHRALGDTHALAEVARELRLWARP